LAVRFIERLFESGFLPAAGAASLRATAGAPEENDDNPRAKPNAQRQSNFNGVESAFLRREESLKSRGLFASGSIVTPMGVRVAMWWPLQQKASRVQGGRRTAASIKHTGQVDRNRFAFT
jgi:hypothetical protein